MVALSIIGSLLAQAADQGVHDAFFPQLTSDSSAIHWQDGYFYVDGKPVIISSGSIHYARVPREQWRDRILRLKMKHSIGLVTKDVLKAGHIWLNGHNLGETPQPFPHSMPECWLKEGNNDLVVVDLYGTRPDKLQIVPYEAFSVTEGK